MRLGSCSVCSLVGNFSTGSRGALGILCKKENREIMAMGARGLFLWEAALDQE